MKPKKRNLKGRILWRASAWGAVLSGVMAAVSLGAGREGREEADVRRDAVVRAVEEVMHSVVNISTETVVEARDPLDGLLRDFFGYGRRPPGSENSLGSGVIIDETGYVLTNFHVVRRATRITVTLWDGRKFEAREVIGTARSDVALLKLELPANETLRAARFAPDDDLLLGETVLALGNPFGLGGSVSRGILSSKSRRPAEENQPLEIQDWLQTDAAINPGNSGGPLVNLRGELIGINVAIFREGQGIGFAIPVKRVAEALGDIFTVERMRGLWFGARFQKGNNGHGLVVTSVQAGSPAQKAGLAAGDRVLRVNDSVPGNLVELNREIMAAAGSRTVNLVVQRNRERRNITVRLIPEEDFFNAALVREKIGAVLEEMPAEMAARMRLGAQGGLLVARVDRTGPAAEAELRQGYVVQAADGQAVGDVVSLAKMLHGKKAGEAVFLDLIIPRQQGNFLRLLSARTRVVVR